MIKEVLRQRKDSGLLKISEQLNLISQGVNPMTGEIFNLDLIASDPVAYNSVLTLAQFVFPAIQFPKPKPTNSLNRPVDKIFQRLREWRLNMAAIVNLPAYYVFSDEELYAFAGGDITRKEDLLRCKGMGPRKYELYADDIFQILQEYI